MPTTALSGDRHPSDAIGISDWRRLSSVTKIGALELLRQIGIVGECFEHDVATCQRIDAIGQRQCLLDQLLDQQDRNPLFAKLSCYAKHTINQYWREPGR